MAGAGESAQGQPGSQGLEERKRLMEELWSRVMEVMETASFFHSLKQSAPFSPYRF